jgi:hypothetical protein
MISLWNYHRVSSGRGDDYSDCEWIWVWIDLVTLECNKNEFEGKSGEFDNRGSTILFSAHRTNHAIPWIDL